MFPLQLKFVPPNILILILNELDMEAMFVKNDLFRVQALDDVANSSKVENWSFGEKGERKSNSDVKIGFRYLVIEQSEEGILHNQDTRTKLYLKYVWITT